MARRAWVDAGGAQQGLGSLGVVRLEFGVLDVAARARARRVHRGGEVAAGLIRTMIAQGQQPQAFFGFGDFHVGAQQRLILGGRCIAGQKVGARQAGVGVGDAPLEEIFRRHRQTGNGAGLEIASLEMPPDQRLDFRGGFAVGVAISRILIHALAQVV